MTKPNHDFIATWTIELNCDCPECGEYVNLLDYCDFWDGRGSQQIPIRGEIEADCPECMKQIKVTAEY